MRNSKSVAFSTCFTHTRTPYTCIQSCTHSSQTQRQHSCVSLWLWDGEKGKEKERKKERERERGRESSCWWGWTEPLQRHTDRSLWKERITCARLLSCHILIPGRAHLGTNFTPLYPTQSPTAEPPQPPPSHSALQLSALPPLCCCSLVSGTHSQTHTHTHTLTHTHAHIFTKATPTTGLPHVCQEHQVGWRGRGSDSLTLCWSVCLTFLLLFKREEKKKLKKKREKYYLRYLFLRVDYVDALRVET